VAFDAYLWARKVNLPSDRFKEVSVVHFERFRLQSVSRKFSPQASMAMKIAIISARYTEEENLDAFFQSIFGYGNASVTVRHFRDLTPCH
jgi:hypothetical protein